MVHFSKLLTEYENTKPPTRLGIFGDPIAHSLSPLIHNTALLATGFDVRYSALHVTSKELPEALAALRESNFLGLNLTLPHKKAALSLVDEVTPHAQLLGSINTVVVRDQKLYGHNTDGPGFVAALEEEGGPSFLKQKRILIVGAGGGTGRAIAAQCALEGCSALFLANRSDFVSSSFSALTSAFPLLPLHFLPLQQETLFKVVPNIDLIVNATPLGMQSDDPLLIPPSLFHQDHFLYDVVYTSKKTPLIEAALQEGARVSNGLSMLLHQGALAFSLWFRQPPPIEAMRKTLFSSHM